MIGRILGLLVEIGIGFGWGRRAWGGGSVGERG